MGISCLAENPSVSQVIYFIELLGSYVLVLSVLITKINKVIIFLIIPFCVMRQCRQYSDLTTGWTIHGSNLGSGKGFFSSQKYQTASGANTASYSMGTGFLSWV